MKVTIAEAKREVKQWGFRLTYSSEFKEYIVHDDRDNVGLRHSCELCYFTDDRQDALDTAHEMYLRNERNKEA